MKYLIISIILTILFIGLLAFFFAVVSQWPDGAAVNRPGGIILIDYFTMPAFFGSLIIFGFILFTLNKYMDYRNNHKIVGRIFSKVDPYGEENWVE